MSQSNTIVIVKKHVAQEDGSVVEVFSCLEDRYRLWLDRTPGSTRWRWSLKDWPDDGLGIPSHGAAPDVETAARACAANWRLRESVQNSNSS